MRLNEEEVQTCVFEAVIFLGCIGQCMYFRCTYLWIPSWGPVGVDSKQSQLEPLEAS